MFRKKTLKSKRVDLNSTAKNPLDDSCDGVVGEEVLESDVGRSDYIACDKNLISCPVMPKDFERSSAKGKLAQKIEQKFVASVAQSTYVRSPKKTLGQILHNDPYQSPQKPSKSTYTRNSNLSQQRTLYKEFYGGTETEPKTIFQNVMSPRSPLRGKSISNFQSAKQVHKAKMDNFEILRNQEHNVRVIRDKSNKKQAEEFKNMSHINKELVIDDNQSKKTQKYKTGKKLIGLLGQGNTTNRYDKTLNNQISFGSLKVTNHNFEIKPVEILKQPSPQKQFESPSPSPIKCEDSDIVFKRAKSPIQDFNTPKPPTVDFLKDNNLLSFGDLDRDLSSSPRPAVKDFKADTPDLLVRHTENQYQNLSNIVPRQLQNQSNIIQHEIKNSPKGNKKSLMDEMNTQYLEQAKILVKMLKSNPKTLIQANQVQFYIDNHYKIFIQTGRIQLVIQGYTKLQSYIEKLLIQLQDADSRPEEADMQVHLVLSILQGIESQMEKAQNINITPQKWNRDSVLVTPNRDSMLSGGKIQPTERSLFSSKSGKRKIKLLKNGHVVKAVQEMVNRNKSFEKESSKTPDPEDVIQSLKQIVNKNQEIFQNIQENMFSPDSKYNRKNSERLSVRMSQSLVKAKDKLNHKIAKEQERVSVAGSMSGSVASSQIFNLGNMNLQGNQIKRQQSNLYKSHNYSKNNKSFDLAASVAKAPENMPFDKFEISCKHLIKSKFNDQQYAQLVSVQSLYKKFCSWNTNQESYLRSTGSLPSDEFERQRQALNRAHQFIIREYTAQIQSYKVQFNDIDQVSEKDEPRESQVDNLNIKFDVLTQQTPNKEAIELSRSPVRHRQNNIFSHSKSRGALSQDSGVGGFLSQKSYRRRIVTSNQMDEIDVDKVYTSPPANNFTSPDVKKSFDLSEYIEHQIQNLNFTDTKTPQMEKRLTEEKKSDSDRTDFLGIRRIFGQATPSFNVTEEIIKPSNISKKQKNAGFIQKIPSPRQTSDFSSNKLNQNAKKQQEMKAKKLERKLQQSKTIQEQDFGASQMMIEQSNYKKKSTAKNTGTKNSKKSKNAPKTPTMKSSQQTKSAFLPGFFENIIL